MTEIDIRQAISDIEDITIEEDTDTYIVIWDEGGNIEKQIKFRFEEKFSEDILKSLIYISPKLTEFIDINIITSYIFSLDKNLFTTLEHLCFMWDEEDYDWLFDETGDEYAKFIMDDEVVGRMWNERNICIIDVKNIFKTTYKMMSEDEDSFLGRQYFFEDINNGIMMTAIHELRHLMLDTNIILPEDIYPLELSSEDAVEGFCRDAWDNKRCWCLTSKFLKIEVSKLLDTDECF